MSTDPAMIEEPQALTGDAADDEKLTELEELAVEMGWTPKSKYAGPEEKWKPAKDWVKAERDINRGLKDTVKGLRDTVDRLAKSATKQTERMLKEQAEEINARFVQAVENKDTKAAAAASLEMQQLQREAVSETGGDVEAEFAKQNPWYNTDEDATDYAISISQREARKGKSVPEQLEAVDKAVRKRFPELFAGESQAVGKAPPAVATPTRAASAPRTKGVAELPPAAKEAMEKFVKLAVEKHKKNPDDVRKQYAADYWENAA